MKYPGYPAFLIPGVGGRMVVIVIRQFAVAGEAFLGF
jgi:hypothetical protein